MASKRTTIIWAAVALVAVALAFVLARFVFRADGLIFAIFIVLAVLIAFLVWKAFIKTGKEELKASEARNAGLQAQIDTLTKTVRALDTELQEMSRSKLNVIGLNPIMHISVLNIDTSFVRTFVRENKNLTFNGALRTDLVVEYGIKLEEVRFKYDEMANTLELANFNPGIISYSKKQMNWEMARSYKSRRLFGYDFSDISDREAEAYTKRMCEELRSGLEKEIDSRKVSEFDWLAPLITSHIVDVLKLMVGRSTLNVSIVEAPTEGFVSFDEFKGLVSVPLLAEKNEAAVE